MKEYDKIKLDKLMNVVKTFNDQGFHYPADYKLNFHILMYCRYCKKISITKYISVFDGKVICNCKKCGGRHAMTIKGLTDTRKANRIIKSALGVLAAILLLVIIF